MVKPKDATSIFVGVPKETKPNEGRVGLTPNGVKKIISSAKKSGREINILVEKDTGKLAEFSDSDYEKAGAKIVSASEAWSAPFVIKVKEPLKDEYKYLKKGQVVFTYWHFASKENRDLTMVAIGSAVTAVAYETTVIDGRTPLLAPMSEIAGVLAGFWAAALMKDKNANINTAWVREALSKYNHSDSIDDLYKQGLTLKGKTVLIFGGGMVGEYAALSSAKVGATVTVLDISEPKMEYLRKKFAGLKIEVKNSKQVDIIAELKAADIAVGAIHVPGQEAIKVVTRDVYRKIGKKLLTIDVSIDQGGNFEGSHTTYYDKPVFTDEFGMHFCVANMPSAVPRLASVKLEDAKINYAIALAGGLESAVKKYPELANAVNVRDGKVQLASITKAHNIDKKYLTDSVIAEMNKK